MSGISLIDVVRSREGSEAEFIVHSGRRYGFGEMIRMGKLFAGHLRELSLGRGSRVIIALPPGADHVRSMIGAILNGSVFIPVDPSLPRGKLSHIISDSGADLVISGRKDRDLLSDDNPGTLFEGPGSGGPEPPDAVVEPSDLACIIYTSGSTGLPKGVMLSHGNMVFSADSIISYIGNREGDAILSCLPLSFDYGLYQVIMALRFGGKVVLEPSFIFPGRVLKLLESERVTGFPIVPSMGAILLKRFDLSSLDLSSLEYITNTAQALPEWMIREFRGILPHVKIFSMFGLTECKRCTYLEPSLIDRKPTSVGKAIPGTRVQLVDARGRTVRKPFRIGEMVVKGPNVMIGYLNDEEMTSRMIREHEGERALFTGDLFYFDEEGDLYFQGRKDDLIKVKGEKVYPKEIERVVERIEGITECAVIGKDDEIKGSSLVCFYTSLSPLEGGSIKAILKEFLEPYKIPDLFLHIDNMPRTRNGKVDREGLKGLLRDVA